MMDTFNWQESLFGTHVEIQTSYGYFIVMFNVRLQWSIKLSVWLSHSYLQIILQIGNPKLGVTNCKKIPLFAKMHSLALVILNYD